MKKEKAGKRRFADLVDTEKLDKLVKSFCHATGINCAVLELDGTILSIAKWEKACAIHRGHPETSKRCAESDTALAGNLAEGKRYTIYKCLNGLTDAATPIFVKGRHVANLFLGQCFNTPPDRDFFIRQARAYGFDESEYMDAVDRVPVISEETATRAMEYMCVLAETLGEMGLLLEENRTAMEDIRKMREEMDRKKNRGGKYLTFILGDQEYGIGILKVREIIPLVPATPVPNTPEFVKGVINLRGRVIPVADLRVLLGMTEAVGHDERSCVIITEISGNMQVGLVADRVSEVCQIQGEDIEEAQELGIRINTDCIYGVAKAEGGMKVLLDTESLFRGERFSDMDETIRDP